MKRLKAMIQPIDIFRKLHYVKPIEPMKNELSKSEYWKQRCLLVEQCLAESPCDPDITSDQIEAHKKLREFLSNYKIKESTKGK